MLLTKSVIVKWNSRNKKRLEDKGYIFTKIGDEIEIKIADLTNGSHLGVQVKCDGENCTTPITKPVKYGDYTTHVHEDGKYYCSQCVREFSKIKQKQTILDNRQSFQDWCIENNRQDVLDRFDYEKNDINPDVINHCTATKYYFKCPQGIHPSELKQISWFVSGNEGAIKCKMCNSFAQWGIDNIGENFLEDYWDFEKNNKLGIDPWIITRNSNVSKVWLKCIETDYHGSYDAMCESFVRGCRCTYCAGIKTHEKDSLYQYIIDNFGEEFFNKIWSDKNIKSAKEYRPFSGTEVYWKCENNEHEDFLRRIRTSNKADFRCAACVSIRRESMLQQKTREYLNELGYNLLHENKCTLVPQNPKYKGKYGKMPFDNEVVGDLKLIVEVMGSQHYESCTWHTLTAKRNGTTPEYELFMQKVRDRYKSYVAYRNGYNYLALSYKTDNKKEEYKKLIDKKIKEINKKNKKIQTQTILNNINELNNIACNS